MNAGGLIAALERFGRALPRVVDGVSGAEARWKPAGGAWSILEVVRHLGDEEVEDFRTRVRLTLAGVAAGEWPAIDPEGWAVARKYNEGELGEAVARFVREREASVAWLRALGGGADWGRAYEHPQYGPIYAGQLLGSWAAHDALHLRQIAKRMFELAGEAGGYDVRYAGEWRA